MAVRMPGPTTSGSSVRCLRHSAVMVTFITGTTHATATPPRFAASGPLNRLRISTPYSSSVRPSSVWMRQCWSSVFPSYTPSTVWVLPTSMTNSFVMRCPSLQIHEEHEWPRMNTKSIAPRSRVLGGSSCSFVDPVPFVEYPQPIEGKELVHLVDGLRLRRDDARQAAGGEDAGADALLVLDAAHQAVDGRRVAEQDAGLQGVHGGAADGLRRPAQLDRGQARGVGEQRLAGDAHAGTDDAARVDAVGGDVLDLGGGA